MSFFIAQVLITIFIICSFPIPKHLLGLLNDFHAQNLAFYKGLLLHYYYIASYFN